MFAELWIKKPNVPSEMLRRIGDLGPVAERPKAIITVDGRLFVQRVGGSECEYFEVEAWREPMPPMEFPTTKLVKDGKGGRKFKKVS